MYIHNDTLHIILCVYTWVHNYNCLCTHVCTCTCTCTYIHVYMYACVSVLYTCNGTFDVGKHPSSHTIKLCILSHVAGMILHFQLPHLVDYYIIDPQCWFGLCALVISPENVSKLVRSAGIMARGQSREQ